MKSMVNGWIQTAVAELSSELTVLMSALPEEKQLQMQAAISSKFNFFEKLI